MDQLILTFFDSVISAMLFGRETVCEDSFVTSARPPVEIAPDRYIIHALNSEYNLAKSPSPIFNIIKQSGIFPPAPRGRFTTIFLNLLNMSSGQPGGQPPGEADDMCIMASQHDHFQVGNRSW